MNESAVLFACFALKECQAKKGCDFEILENGWVSGDASQYGSWNVKQVWVRRHVFGQIPSQFGGCL